MEKMTTSEYRKSKWEPGGAWNGLILFLSAYVVFALIYGSVGPKNPELSRYLGYGDTAACAFFLADAFLRWLAAPDRLAYWKYGWIDVLSSIPNVAPLRWGRLFQALRIIRAIRAMRATMRLSEYFFENKFKSGFAATATLMLASMAICGSLILSFERNAKGATIVDASDALWWCANTITTVGASGINPVTQEGRLVGIFLMFTGVGLFTANSAMTVAWFLRDRNGQDNPRMPTSKNSAQATADRAPPRLFG